MKKFKLLIFIDDREADNYYNKYIVDSSNLCEESLFFNKAKKALSHIKRNLTQYLGSSPDIIFVDLVMPEMDCWGFLKEYAKFPKLKTKN